MGKRRPGAFPQRLRHLLEYWLLLSVGSILRHLPYSFSLRMADFLGDITFSILRIRREVTLKNLEMAFGQKKSKKELKKIARESYRKQARSFVSHMLFPVLSKEKILSDIEFENLQYFDEILKYGKGGILVSSHFGNWQLGGVSCKLAGYPMNFLVQRQSNPLVENLAYKYIEEKGVKVLYKGVSAGDVMELLNSNEIVGMLPDQDAGKSGVVVNFMGKPASTHKGPAFFSLKAGAPIVVGLIFQNRDGKHKLILEKPIYPQNTGDTEADIKKLTQAFTTKIEEYVRKFPDHWFWQHRRWKSTLNLY